MTFCIDIQGPDRMNNFGDIIIGAAVADQERIIYVHFHLD